MFRPFTGTHARVRAAREDGFAPRPVLHLDLGDRPATGRPGAKPYHQTPRSAPDSTPVPTTSRISSWLRDGRDLISHKVFIKSFR